ncbi:hypothetical protein CI610_03002 [invertebrate metagenome]|uniref:C2H2-type domain-containing protein n=1 Tax=invertebrate metagenome TaxID=1711999 RepID=A0A2H9T4A7_9ZZZZ
MPALLLLLLFWGTLCEGAGEEKREFDDPENIHQTNKNLPLKKRKVLIQQDDHGGGSFIVTPGCDDCEWVAVEYKVQRASIDLKLIKQEPDEPDQDKSCIKMESADSCPNQLVNAVGVQSFGSSDGLKPFTVTIPADGSHACLTDEKGLIKLVTNSDMNGVQTLSAISTDRNNEPDAKTTFYCKPDSTSLLNTKCISVTCVPQKNTKEKPFPCHHPGCTFSTTQSGSLKRHQLTHSGEKPFPCHHPGCIFSTARSSYLKTHQRIHSGEKPFQCHHPGCTFSTTTSGSLKTHKLTHSGEKPFPCHHPGCTFSTTTSGSLKTHKLTHSGEKPFPCHHPACIFSTTTRGSLKRHQLTHSGEKPFPCHHQGCTFSTTQSGNLKRHQFTHSGEKPFPCHHPGCTFSTNQSSSLKRHQLTHSGEDLSVSPE